MRTRTRLWPLLLAVAVGLGLPACTGEPVDETGEGAAEVTPPTYPDGEETDGMTEPAGDPILLAIDTALATVDDARVYALEAENAGTVWEVEVVDRAGTRFEIDISADGEEVLRGPDAKSSEPKHLQRVESATLPIEDVLQVALEHYPGKVIEFELDHEDGRVVWEVEVAGEDGLASEFDIDAATGEILP